MSTDVSSGSCSCGAIQIEVTGDPAFVSLCHCHNCQKSSSTAFSTNWIVPRPKFRVAAGQVTTYAVNENSSRQFCGTCSSVMWVESTKFPGIVVVKAGVMDDGGIGRFKPSSEAFTSRKPGWVGCVEGAAQFEEQWKA